MVMSHDLVFFHNDPVSRHHVSVIHSCLLLVKMLLANSSMRLLIASQYNVLTKAELLRVVNLHGLC